MTVEEALKIVKNNLSVAVHDADGINPEYEYEQVKALEMASDALEKQIPMKPNFGKAQGSRWRSCPACCARVINTYKFCDQCGQKLDWGHEQ